MTGSGADQTSYLAANELTTHRRVTGRINGISTIKKSQFVQTLDAIQDALQPLFRQYGFRKRGRSYNSSCSDGIVQVINFQMGQYPIGKYEIPGLRENLYGWFTVNLGVYLPAVEAIETGGKAKKFYQAY